MTLTQRVVSLFVAFVLFGTIATGIASANSIADTVIFEDDFDSYPVGVNYVPYNNLLLFDNFSTDSGQWEYIGNAYRDEGNGYVVLTEAVHSQVGVGVIWFKPGMSSNFTVEFKYKAGGGSGADGIVFMFYKDGNYVPAGGLNLGFVEDYNPVVQGYGIEFDNWNNWDFNDPSANHIALIKDNVASHLIYVNDRRTEDNLWHDVKVTVNETDLLMELDGSELLSWSGSFDKTYSGFGFSGATGAANNWHLIDDVRITCESEIVEADINFDPDTLNLGSGGKWVTAYIELPDGYDVAGINASSVFLNDTVSAVTDPMYEFVTNESEYLVDRDGDGITERMLKFDREEVEAILEAGDEVTVTFEGKIGYENEATSGMAVFVGTDSITVIESSNVKENNGKKK